ncbi:nucleotide exchange factor GrpE [Lichenicoccus sp.]|uniref:nucleotide exchange factor GrpE n=1 Tax=Lichenicoccus sp. TaxID=2781899 RepID=UPI003D0F0C94
MPDPHDAEPTSSANAVPADLQEDPTPAAGSETVMQAATARIRELEAGLEEMRDKWLRSEAEIQNVRTRSRRDVDDARQYAVQKFARDVVEVAENLRRGLASLPPASENDNPLTSKLREGFESVERSFLGILERNGITGTDPTGALFDANLHQAMAEQPSADHPPGTVLQAWTSAWTLNGRLLKPAMVVVAKATGDDAARAHAGAAAKAHAGATGATESLDKTV